MIPKPWAFHTVIPYYSEGAYNILGDIHMYVINTRQGIKVSKSLIPLNAMGPQWKSHNSQTQTIGRGF